MNTVSKLLIGFSLMVGITTVTSNGARAQMGCGQMKGMAMDTTAKYQMAMNSTHSGVGRGKVMAISMKDKTLTLAHGDIPGVMMAMTMAYPVSNPAMLHTIAVGDSVTFTLENRGSGSYVVLAISEIKQ